MIYRLIRENLLYILLLPSVFILGCFNISDFDSWTHLSFGRHIVENGSFVTHEVFVYPFLGAAIENPYWLFQIPLYLSYKAGGLAGVIIFKSLIFSLSFLFFARLLREFKANKIYILLFSLLTALLVRFRFVERPEIFGYLFFLIFLYIFTIAYYRETRLIYILPFIQIMWANSHPGASLGILTAVLFTLGAMFKKYIFRSENITKKHQKLSVYILLLFLIIIGYLINPYSYRYFLSPASLATNIEITRSVNEMQPVTFDPAYLTAYLAVLVIGVAVILLNWKRIPLAWIMLFFIFSVVSFRVVRSLPLFFFTAMPLTAFSAGELSGRKIRHKIYSAAISVVMAAAVFYSGIYGKYAFGFGEEKQLFASGAVDFIKGKGIEDKRIFNYFGWGGYLSWKLGEGRAFIDGRYASGSLLNDYDHIIAASSIWRELVQKYGIEIIVVNSIGFTDGIIYPLIDTLLSDSSWKPVYADSGSLVFADMGKNNTLKEIPASMVLKEMIDEAGYLYSIGIRGQIEKTIGKLYLKQRDYRNALYYYGKWLERNPSDNSVRGIYELLKNKGY